MKNKRRIRHGSKFTLHHLPANCVTLDLRLILSKCQVFYLQNIDNKTFLIRLQWEVKNYMKTLAIWVVITFITTNISKQYDPK